MGNTKQALHLITNDLRDVNAAIDFCKEHNDTELWNDLISYSIDKPSECDNLVDIIITMTVRYVARFIQWFCHTVCYSLLFCIVSEIWEKFFVYDNNNDNNNKLYYICG